MNMIRPWPQYVNRAIPPIIWRCTSVWGLLHVHQWPVGDAPPAYAITRGPDEKIGWHTLLLKSGTR